MINYEKVFRWGIVILVSISIFSNLYSLFSTSKKTGKIGEVSSNLGRIEGKQSELTSQITRFEQEYIGLGDSISGLGTTISNIGTDISKVKFGLQGLGTEIRNIKTRIPELTEITRRTDDGISEAERILADLKAGNF